MPTGALGCVVMTNCVAGPKVRACAIELVLYPVALITMETSFPLFRCALTADIRRPLGGSLSDNDNLILTIGARPAHPSEGSPSRCPSLVAHNERRRAPTVQRTPVRWRDARTRKVRGHV